MHNCNFNKTALLVEFRRLIWKMELYKKDAKAANHPLCEKVLSECEADLKKYSKKFEDAIFASLMTSLLTITWLFDASSFEVIQLVQRDLIDYFYTNHNVKHQQFLQCFFSLIPERK